MNDRAHLGEEGSMNEQVERDVETAVCACSRCSAVLVGDEPGDYCHRCEVRCP